GGAIVIVTLRDRAERDRASQASMQAFQLSQEVTRARAALCARSASEALPAELSPAPSWVFRLDPRGEWRLVDELAADVAPERVICIQLDGPRTHAIATYDLVGHQLGFARLEDVTEAGLRDYVERSRQRLERLPPP
ncbi:MAG: hypothetical protein NT062_29190, partial [Proteobacteria bacterium]|nr:hypothetical protein [Pseudomonadota bacterium]